MRKLLASLGLAGLLGLSSSCISESLSESDRAKLSQFYARSLFCGTPSFTKEEREEYERLRNLNGMYLKKERQELQQLCISPIQENQRLYLLSQLDDTLSPEEKMREYERISHLEGRDLEKAYQEVLNGKEK